MERKEAIEIVRSNFPNGRIQLSEALKTLIPELAESEDERIIQALLKFFSNGANNNETTCDIPDNKIVEWIKKQGELKSNWSENDEIRKTIVPIIKRYIGYVGEESCEPHVKDFFIKEAEEAISWLEKQGESSKSDIDCQPHKGDADNHYDMTFEEAQQYASDRGIDIPINDGDVFVDERYITQTIGNILRWADEHPKQEPMDLPNFGRKLLELKSADIVNHLLEDKIEGTRRELVEFLSNTINAQWDDIVDSAQVYAQRITNIIKGQELPEWTQDDRDTLDWICRIIYRAKQDRLISQEEESFLGKWMDKWLNHSPEWKEQDKKMLDSLITIFDTQYHDSVYSTESGLVGGIEIVDWLKSLKTPNQWKPTEEQMQTLHAQLNEGALIYPEDKRVLTTLYEDLQKL